MVELSFELSCRLLTVYDLLDQSGVVKISLAYRVRFLGMCDCSSATNII
jgi:hypothetical protein